MKSYTFHDIEQGMEEQFTVCVTEEKMDQFRAVTLDTNPLHRDPDYARANGYEDKVVFGMLTTSFISTLCASFIEPVYVGDELSVSGRVVEKSDALQMITIKWSINNQLEACVARGKVRVRVRK